MDGITNVASVGVKAPLEIAIASGVLIATQSAVIVASESSTTDTLDTITLSSQLSGYGVLLLLRAKTGHTITVSHDTGNILLSGEDDFELSGDKELWLYHDGTDARDVSTSGAGGGGSTLPVADTTAIVKGSADATKQVRFEVDGLTTGTTRVVTVPDADLTLTGLTNTQTLTNKTLTTPTIGDLSNATHNHTNAAGGGQLTDAALSSAVGIAKGGTGQTTQTAAFDALSPLTTQGDLLYHNGTNNVRLAKGTANQQIRMNAGATAPEWFTPSGGGSWDYVELRHTASSGTNGGTNTASAWTTLPLDTEVADTGSICTLSSNEFSLPAGTYELDGLHEFYSTGGARIRLYNVTDTAVISTGLSAYAIVTSSSVRGHLMCRFTLGGTKTLRMEYYTVLSSSGTGLGVATGAGVDEIYGIITIRKVA